MKKRFGQISIIVLNWDSAKSTIDCVNSVLQSGFQDFQIHIVDNGSTDNSVVKLQQAFEENERVNLIQTKKNLGFGGGINFGAEKAISLDDPEFLLILNNDIVLEKDALQALFNGTQEFGQENIYFPLILKWNSDIIQLAGIKTILPLPFRFKHAWEKDYGQLETEESAALNGAVFLISTELYKKLTGFDDEYFLYVEDVDFGYRAQKEGSKIILIPSAKIWHKHSESLGKFSPVKTYYCVRNYLYFLNDHAIGTLAKTYTYILLTFGIIFSFLALQFKQTKAIVQGISDFRKGKMGTMS